MTRGDPGLFGPGSAAWRINREALVLAGGTAALLMQLAHPAVAAGVEQHSTFRTDPFGRLKRTLNLTYAWGFGSSRRADRALRRIDAVHAAVRGRVPESGEPYAARDPELVLWVHATLVDAALRVHDRYIAPLTREEAQAYHAELRVVAIRLGVPEERMPATLDAMRTWMAAQLDEGRVWVTPTARALAPSVLWPARFPPRPVWTAAHMVSFSVLPPAIRAGYGIAWGAWHEAVMRGVAAYTRRVLPLMPPVLRHVPAARRAERRAARPPGQGS
ncbi:MAG TPA: oxygenase MpaB family protein [candidate division Zixibacteria bacterium]|nr:oxygenase MpaB family protein [candidate division Zixibacteria bacterium]